MLLLMGALTWLAAGTAALAVTAGLCRSGHVEDERRTYPEA